VALVDRDLYLPKSWTDDRARGRAAGVPDEVGLQTKPQLGQAMLERALAVGVPFGWVTGDTVDGGDRRLRTWLRLNAGDGGKGKRCYHWTRVPLWRWGWPANVGFWLLARRSLSDPGELAYDACFAPADTPLVTLVQVAGKRWRVEEAFEHAKGEVGLDHYQVRQYPAWYRHVTLAMVALAFLAVTRARLPDREEGLGGRSW
jgi:SRSO17 transposase